jgi:hypothetical protein
MVCFCQNTASDLALALPSIAAAAELNLNADSQAILAIGASLAGSGLPAGPGSPDPAWQQLQLPSISLSASEVATISAAAYLRAQVLAQFGIDLLNPAQASAFVRLAATLSARLSAMANASASASLGASAWPQLAATLNATAQVEAALSTGVLVSAGSQPEMASSQPMLAQLQLLLPMTSLSAQLDLDLSANFSAQLTAQLQAIMAIPMPQLPVATVSMMATLSASLNAIAQLSASLGVNPLQAGAPAVEAMVSARADAVAQMAMSMGVNLPALAASLPGPGAAVNPPSFATAATVNAVMSLNTQALASLDLAVPAAASLPVLTVGLPTASIAAQLAAMGFAPSTAPCGGMCDARSLLNAAVSASGGAGAGGGGGPGKV